ncbi:tripartite tricarboxylate transporter substrate-binding protein [Pseudonocardia thermophila]|uniref:tripartite tricarboxylate transporter substrate-binding protein n=1 Tax=Pseudonocardia thermophila TaxID=1848 RepID=UPI00248EDD71|nr:tripartite tricarboxylate transporter substrate-binding protein [Pseudonocardia thermophila]
MGNRLRGFATAVALGTAVLAGCSSGAAASGSDAALPACSALEGKPVALVVPYEPGGGYDSYARLLAPYLERGTGATIAVENKPGAGGLLALNNLRAERPDGTTIAIMNGVGAGGASLAGAAGARFSLDEFTYIGRVVSEPPLIVTSATGPYQTFDAVRQAHGFRWGSTGPGAEDYVTASLLTKVFGIDAEVVTGFPGSGETELAVLQGAIDGMSGNPGSRRAAIEEGTQTPVLRMGEQPPPWLHADVPWVRDVPMTDEQRALIDAHLALIEIGRPLVGPPGMDQAATTCWREAMAAAMADPELIAAAEQQERELAFLPGAELDVLVRRILTASPHYRELLASMY